MICNEKMTPELGCELVDGHVGLHVVTLDGTKYKWIKKHTGSTGYMSPQETWPDDSEADKEIAEAETIAEAFWEVGEKYDVPTTGNSPRWQEGQFLRPMGDFIRDCVNVARRFK